MSEDEDRIKYIQQMPDEQWQAFKNALEAHSMGAISKRTLLKYLGVGGVALAGGTAATGSVLADASTSDADGNIGTPSNRVDIFADGIDATSLAMSDITVNSITTGEASVTNETFIRGTRGANSTSTTAGTYINLFDGESKDVRNEFNASAQFVPDQTGEYLITVTADVRGSTVAGDQIGGRVWDVDAGTAVLPQQQVTSPNSSAIVPFVFFSNLTSGITYEIQVTNTDSSFVLNASNCEGVISRSVVA